jgi:molybdopterin/thiamine biosynthesis adenylyltransferase/molybdopterin converting factor small subunit
MPARILIPTPLRPYAGKNAEVQVSASTVAEAMDRLTAQYGDLRRHLFTDDGKLRSFVNVYVNEQDIRYLQKETTPVGENDVISIVPSIAGGSTAATMEPPVKLTNDEVLRYSRHLIMPEVGMTGQLKLKKAKVLLVGTGGLGSPMALYLAAAGVGTLGLVDFDVVDFTNLQRQIAHGTKDVGRPKLDSARSRLADINPEVKVVGFETRITSANAMDIIKDFDIVADGTDNFPTRYLVNDACILQGKPNVYASIFRFEGQASVFGLEDGPCYRCLYPEPPPPGLVPSCAEGGVLGILPGLLGVIQATEVAGDEVSRVEVAQEPGVSDLRAESDYSRANRLRGILRHPRRRARGRHRRARDYAARVEAASRSRRRCFRARRTRAARVSNLQYQRALDPARRLAGARERVELGR